MELNRTLRSCSRLDGRVAVVTGAVQGIGLAIIERLAEAGAIVVLADKDPRVHEVAAAIAAKDVPAFGIELDVSDSASIDRAVTTIVATHGRLDVWVNNAGIYPESAALEMDEAEWHKVIGVNTDGVFFGARAAARAMSERASGVILNMSSTAAFRGGSAGRAHYVASKSAVNGLTMALAGEFGPLGIRVLGIAPVWTQTPGFTGATTLRTGSEEGATLHVQSYADRLPLRRVATADDIALVAAFAVSDQAGFITGVTIPVDGGYLAV